ncbi:MAG: LuxR C-terminal-related transcriptional regulator, partial [Gallionellaceae bacterium]
GHTSKEIAQRLEISFRTVEIHRAHIMQKTGAANLLELARIAATFASLQADQFKLESRLPSYPICSNGESTTT